VGAPLFGETAYEDGLRDLVVRLGLEDRVEMTGFREDVGAELGRLDVLVLASVTAEGFGQVIVEGMAAGLAVVATRAGGPEEIVTDGHDGLLCPPGDVAALATTLRRLQADEGLRRRLGKAARTTAVGYTPAVIAPQVLELYHTVLRR
jgi:glycosyltransferase involved in cell wall biosynthesis